MNNPLPIKDVSTGTPNPSDWGAYPIEIRNVTKRFLTPTGKAYTAIRDVNMAVAPGEFVAVKAPGVLQRSRPGCRCFEQNVRTQTNRLIRRLLRNFGLGQRNAATENDCPEDQEFYSHALTTH